MEKVSLGGSPLVLHTFEDVCWYSEVNFTCISVDELHELIRYLHPVRYEVVGVTLHLSCRILRNCHDDASKFIYLLAKPSCDYLEQEDFIPLLQVPSTAQQ